MSPSLVPSLPRSFLMLVLVVVLCPAAGRAAPALCPAPEQNWLPWPDPGGGRVEVGAREVDLADREQVVLTGDVLVRDRDQELRADYVRYDRPTERLEALGEVRFRTREFAVAATRADLALGADAGRLDEVTYVLERGAARGTAEVVHLESRTRTRLEDVIFTTCPLEDRDWELVAREMTLDQATGRGEARRFRLRFKDTTLLALPYATFPIDDRRQSGFLIPGIGSSDDNGLDIALPWYWNIAPNQDATITPRLITDRGTMLGLEYRYLGARSVGELRGAYLPNDDLVRRHRGQASYLHRTRFSDRLFLNVDLNHVSDEAWFEDFGDSLQATSVSFLRSVASLEARGAWWDAVLMADAYETVDEDIRPRNEPYDRLPRAEFRGVRPLGRNAELRVDAELARFARATGVEGARADFFPRLALPLYRPGWYVTPTLGVRYTRYDLQREADASPSRSTAIASVEGGLVFDRRLADGRLQTLEPRVHYLYVPFADQDALPAFDTAPITFGFDQLFRTNRFTGADRQADANQLGLGLTTRLFDAAGTRETVTASIGTIVYFRDQKVQLRGRPPEDPATSPLVAEFQYRPSDFWRTTLGFQYDPEDDEFDQTIAQVQYRRPGGRIFNIAYRRRDERVRQFDLSFLQPLRERWRLIGRLNYSFLDETDLETLLGFEYESCCWAVRTFARRYLRNQAGDKRNGLYLELELKGLGSLGRDSDRVLEQAIAGYRSEDYL